MDIISRLREFSFLSNLKTRELEALVARLSTKHFKAGDCILKQGAKSDKVHLLIEGSVQVTAKSRDDRNASIILQRAPSMFGMIEIWKELPHLGSVEAIEPCTTLVLTRSQYLVLLNSNQQACINIIQMLSDQIYENGVDHRVRIFGTTQHILARYLWVLVQSYGQKYQTGILVKRKLNKSLIARALGLSRRQIIREFEVLEKNGMLEWHENDLFIPSGDKLKKLSEGAWLERRASRR